LTAYTYKINLERIYLSNTTDISNYDQ